MSDNPAPMGEDTGNLESQADGPETTEAPKADDYQSRIDQRLEEMSRAQQQQAEEFRQWRESFNQPEEDDEDPYPLDEGDDGFEEQEAQRFLQELVDRQVQEKLAPYQQQQANEKRDQAYENLQSRLPEFKDEAVAKKYIGEAVEWFERNNLHAAIEDQRLVEYAEMRYKAAKADERAAQETPPQRTPSLESGGGAAPQDTDEDAQDRIIRQLSQSSW
jgi:hypothetical protein